MGSTFVAPSRGTRLRVSFGLVGMNVKYAPLVPSDAGRAKGKMLCATHRAPIRYEKVCTEDGKPCETVTGYERDGDYVVVDKDELGLDRDGGLELRAIVEVGAIDPLYYEKTHLLWPDTGGRTRDQREPQHAVAFNLLAAGLRKSRKAAIGTTVMNKSTRVVVVRWSDVTSTLVAHVCTYDASIAWNDVRLVEEGLAGLDEPEKAHVAVVEQLFATLEADGFDFQAVSDEYDGQLRDAIDAAAAGRPAPKHKAAKDEGKVVDLMEALKASVAAAADEKPAKKKPARRKAAA